MTETLTRIYTIERTYVTLVYYKDQYGGIHVRTITKV
jgi:hypothetical protein